MARAPGRAPGAGARCRRTSPCTHGSPSFDPYDVTRGARGRPLVRLLTMRGTIHLLTPADAVTLRPWTQPALDRVQRNHAAADAGARTASRGRCDRRRTGRPEGAVRRGRRALPDLPSGDRAVIARGWCRWSSYLRAAPGRARRRAYEPRRRLARPAARRARCRGRRTALSRRSARPRPPTTTLVGRHPARSGAGGHGSRTPRGRGRQGAVRRARRRDRGRGHPRPAPAARHLRQPLALARRARPGHRTRQAQALDGRQRRRRDDALRRRVARGAVALADDRVEVDRALPRPHEARASDLDDEIARVEELLAL